MTFWWVQFSCVCDMKELCMMSSRGKVHDISNPCCWLKYPTRLKIPMHINLHFAFNIYTNTQIISCLGNIHKCHGEDADLPRTLQRVIVLLVDHELEDLLLRDVRLLLLLLGWRGCSPRHGDKCWRGSVHSGKVRVTRLTLG